MENIKAEKVNKGFTITQKNKSRIDGYMAIQFDDGEEIICKDMPHFSGKTIYLELSEPNGSITIGDGKGKTCKLFIKPIEECKENIE